MLVTLSCDDPFSWTMLTFPFSKTKLLYKNGWNPNSQSRLAGVVPLFPSVKHTALFGTLFNDKNWPGGQQATSPLSAKVREIIAKTPKHVIFIIITHIHRSDQLDAAWANESKFKIGHAIARVLRCPCFRDNWLYSTQCQERTSPLLRYTHPPHISTSAYFKSLYSRYE